MTICITPIPKIKPSSTVNVWITETLLGEDGFERNVGMNTRIDPNMTKQAVLDLWHHECRQQDGNEVALDRFPRDPEELRWRDQFKHTTEAPWKNHQLIGPDLIKGQRATAPTKKTNGSDGSTGSTDPDSGSGPDAGSSSDTAKEGGSEQKDTGYHSTRRQPGTRNVELSIRFEGQEWRIAVSPKSDDNDLRLKVIIIMDLLGQAPEA
jgi:hypothetical protein